MLFDRARLRSPGSCRFFCRLLGSHAEPGRAVASFLPNHSLGLGNTAEEAPFMTISSNVEALGLTPSEHQVQLRRAVIASTVGTAIEWYDFFLYSTVTGLVFAKLFFPHSDPWVGTLEAFAIYAVGFIARPVGAAIFGHYGDRIGRKSTLIATLLLMGLATFAVALVPTYESIGIWGAVILTVLYRKKSYHSIAVPIVDAITARRSWT